MRSESIPTPKRPPFGISGSTLKLIAIITMFIDHAGATVIRAIAAHPAVVSDNARRALWSDIYSVSRDIGRIAFPIFCFLIVEGFLHTRNVRKYAQRLFLFALLSEIPFDLALKGNWYFPAKQNVYFTLLIGLLVLVGFEYVCGPVGRRKQENDSMKGSEKQTDTPMGNVVSGRSHPTEAAAKGNIPAAARPVLCLVILAAGMYLAYRINTDYNFKGVFLIAILYLLHNDRTLQCFGGAAGVAWEMPAPVAFLPVYLYNGTRGLRMKYFFYFFYPVHLLLLHMAAQYLVPMI